MQEKFKNIFNPSPLGLIPKKWEVLTLNDVLEITSSKRIFMSEYQSAGVPFYRGKEIIEKSKGAEISTDLFISEEKFNDIDKRFGSPKENDILLSSVGTLGIPYLVNKGERFYFKDGNITWLRNYTDKIFPKYLYYWIISPEGKQQILGSAIGSTQQALTIDNLKRTTLAFPNINEQRRIAEILSSLDDKIELNRKMNKTLESIAQAIFKRWFVDFEFPNENGKPYKSNGGKMVESELGKIPEGWRIGKLKDEFLIVMGQSPKGTSYNEVGEGMLFFQGSTDFGYRFPSARLFTTDPQRIAEKDDVLLSVRAPVGDINVAYDQCCIGRGLAAIRSAQKTYAFYKVSSLVEHFNKYNAEGTVFGSINKATLENIETIIPSKKTINLFELYIGQIDKKIYDNSIQIQVLFQIRDSLLPRLMSGRVRV